MRFFDKYSKVVLRRHQGHVTHLQKEAITKYHHSNHIDKIQKSQLCTMNENLTPTVQSSQEIKYSHMADNVFPDENPKPIFLC